MKKLTFVLVIFALFFTAEAVFAAKCQKNFQTWVAEKHSQGQKGRCFKKALRLVKGIQRYKGLFKNNFSHPTKACEVYFPQSGAYALFLQKLGLCAANSSRERRGTTSETKQSGRSKIASKRKVSSFKLEVQHYQKNVADQSYVGCKVGRFPVGRYSGKIDMLEWNKCVKDVIEDGIKRCRRRHIEKFTGLKALRGKPILKQLKCKPNGPWYTQGTSDCLGTGGCKSKGRITSGENIGLASRRAGRVHLYTVNIITKLAIAGRFPPPRILKDLYEGRHVPKGTREARFFMPRRGAFVFVGLDKLVAYILRQPPQKAQTIIKQVKPHVPKNILNQLRNHENRITANENDLKHFHQNFSTVNISAGFTNLMQLDATNTPANPDGSSSGGLRVPKETVYAELAVRLGLGFRLNPKGLLLLAGEIWFARVATQGNMVPGWVVEAGYEWELFKDGDKKWKGKNSYKNRGKVFYAWSLQLTGGYAHMNRNGYHIPFFGAHAVMYNHGFYLRFGLRLGLGLHAPPDKREWLTTTYLGLSVQLGWRGQN